MSRFGFYDPSYLVSTPENNSENGLIWLTLNCGVTDTAVLIYERVRRARTINSDPLCFSKNSW